jgi:peroxiredoxin Q/BCP
MRLSTGLLSLGLLGLLLAGAARAADDKVEVGKPAPSFELPATSIGNVLPDKKDAKKLTLEDFKGRKNVVLFFFPKAMTPGCTAQCKGFTRLQNEFAKLDTVAIGISTDTLADQEKFTERDSLKIPLFADSGKDIAKAYGVLNPTRGFANRVTFVIDKKGIVRKITKVSSAKDDPDETLKYVKDNLTGK